MLKWQVVAPKVGRIMLVKSCRLACSCRCLDKIPRAFNNAGSATHTCVPVSVMAMVKWCALPSGLERET